MLGYGRMQHTTFLGKLIRTFDASCRVGYGDPFMRDAGFGYYYPDPDEVSSSNIHWWFGVISLACTVQRLVSLPDYEACIQSTIKLSQSFNAVGLMEFSSQKDTAKLLAAF